MSPLSPVTGQHKELSQCAVADSCCVPIPAYPTSTSEKLAPKMKAPESTMSTQIPATFWNGTDTLYLKIPHKQEQTIPVKSMLEKSDLPRL